MENKLINHIAFIMDGNGRWANQFNKERTFGHYEGIKVIAKILNSAKDFNIKYFSFFAFSVENWNRPKKEVEFLISLFEQNMTSKVIKKLNEKNIKFNWIGFTDNLSDRLIKKIKTVEEKTKNNKKIIMNIFFNYSGKKDIENAFVLALNNKEKNLDIKKYLLTKDLPEIDLLIRTGNEKRISNFALYDLSYSEIIFEPTLWPDYSVDTFKKNIDEYNNRCRRFGKI